MAIGVKGRGSTDDKNFAAVAPQHTELVSISDGIATVDIAPAAGGALASYRWWRNGAALDWLRPADPGAISGRDAGAMACFPLVPYSNRIRGGRFEFAGTHHPASDDCRRSTP